MSSEKFTTPDSISEEEIDTLSKESKSEKLSQEMLDRLNNKNSYRLFLKEFSNYHERAEEHSQKYIGGMIQKIIEKFAGIDFSSIDEFLTFAKKEQTSSESRVDKQEKDETKDTTGEEKEHTMGDRSKKEQGKQEKGNERKEHATGEGSRSQKRGQSQGRSTQYDSDEDGSKNEGDSTYQTKTFSEPENISLEDKPSEDITPVDNFVSLLGEAADTTPDNLDDGGAEIQEPIDLKELFDQNFSRMKYGNMNTGGESMYRLNGDSNKSEFLSPDKLDIGNELHRSYALASSGLVNEMMDNIYITYTNMYIHLPKITKENYRDSHIKEQVTDTLYELFTRLSQVITKTIEKKLQKYERYKNETGTKGYFIYKVLEDTNNSQNWDVSSMGNNAREKVMNQLEHMYERMVVACANCQPNMEMFSNNPKDFDGYQENLDRLGSGFFTEERPTSSYAEGSKIDFDEKRRVHKFYNGSSYSLLKQKNPNSEHVNIKDTEQAKATGENFSESDYLIEWKDPKNDTNFLLRLRPSEKTGKKLQFVSLVEQFKPASGYCEGTYNEYIQPNNQLVKEKLKKVTTDFKMGKIELEMEGVSR